MSQSSDMNGSSRPAIRVGSDATPRYREQLVDWLARAVVKRLMAEAERQQEARD